jgi:hypothetical protein
LDALRDAWLGFLLANASPEAAAGVKKSIQDGDFVEAVNIAFTLQRPELDALVVPQPPLSRRPQLPISALDIHIASRPVELPDPAGLQIPRTRAQLARDQAMLTTSVAILYSVIALLTFGPKFVGDIYECGAILLWGVGLDFTLDAAVKSIPKKA